MMTKYRHSYIRVAVGGVCCWYELLLGTNEARNIYVNGAFIADCSRPNNNGVNAFLEFTLFGMDFSLPYVHGRGFLPSDTVLKQKYRALLASALIKEKW